MMARAEKATSQVRSPEHNLITPRRNERSCVDRPASLDNARRSRNMRAVKAKDTKPERLVRSAAHFLGLRFRLHRADLPGRPDLVLPKWRTVIFVNGCFWHQHFGCKKAALPKTNTAFWKRKLERNVKRDYENLNELKRLGWRVIVIWECNIRDSAAAITLIRRRFGMSAQTAQTHALAAVAGEPV